jgi:hypothetical protein
MGDVKTWVAVLARASEEDLAGEMHKNGYRTYSPRYRVMTTRFIGRQRRPVGSMLLLLPGVVLVQDWRGWPKSPPITGATGLMPGYLAAEDIAAIMENERKRVFDEIGARGIAGILDQLTSKGRELIEGLVPCVTKRQSSSSSMSAARRSSLSLSGEASGATVSRS